MDNYPFVKCLNPVVIPHKSTGENMIVCCGKCTACRTHKSSVLTLKCNLEARSHNYQHFITLTYNNEFIPLMHAVPVVGSKGTRWMFVSTCDRLDEKGLIINEVAYTQRQINDLMEKVHLNGFFPYLSKRDAQLFLKRLRKHISLITDEKIRFFLCGEFGPKSLRPHFHLLVWHNSETLAESMGVLVNKSWQFGITDCQQIQSSASSYTSGYVNCTGSLPRLYQTGESKPFASHSQFLGEDVFKSSKQEVYRLSATEFVKRSVKLDGSITDFSLWRSIKDRFYPRCIDYSSQNHVQRMCSYTTALSYQGRPSQIKKPLSVAREIVENILSDVFCPPSDIYNLCIDYRYRYRLHEILNGDLITPLLDDVEMDKYKSSYMLPISHAELDHRRWQHIIKVTNRIYRELRISQHFIDFVCDGITDILHMDSCLTMIERFYDDLDLNQLQEFLIAQKDYTLEFGFDNDFVDLFYNNDSTIPLIDSMPFSIFMCDQLRRADEHMKHKRANDYNRFWFKQREL